MIKLRKVYSYNCRALFKLNLDRSQKDFVNVPVSYMAVAAENKNCIPMLIYNDETPVGFFVYGIISDCYVIAGFMIDVNHQRKGYGTRAMKTLIRKIKRDNKINKISLNVSEDNVVAIKIYEKLGFKQTSFAFFVVDEETGKQTDHFNMELDY